MTVTVSPGGMQDYNYVWAQCLEVTLELSCCKFPPADQLEALWSDNTDALLAYVRQVHLGERSPVPPFHAPPAHFLTSGSNGTQESRASCTTGLGWRCRTLWWRSKVVRTFVRLGPTHMGNTTGCCSLETTPSP